MKKMDKIFSPSLKRTGFTQYITNNLKIPDATKLNYSRFVPNSDFFRIERDEIFVMARLFSLNLPEA